MTNYAEKIFGFIFLSFIVTLCVWLAWDWGIEEIIQSDNAADQYCIARGANSSLGTKVALDYGHPYNYEKILCNDKSLYIAHKDTTCIKYDDYMECHEYDFVYT